MIIPYSYYMDIRPATQKDVQTIVKLMLDEFSQPPFNEDVSLEAVVKSLNFYFDIGRVFVAEKDEIVGVCVFKVEQWWQGKVIIIEDLAIKEAFKENKLHLQLLERVEHHTKEIGAYQVCFTTHKDTPTIQDYVSRGYTMKDRVYLERSL